MVYAPRVVRSENVFFFIHLLQTFRASTLSLSWDIFRFSSFRILYAWMFVDSLFREYRVLFLIVPIIIIFITAAIGTGWDNIIMLLSQRPKQCLQIGPLA